MSEQTSAARVPCACGYTPVLTQVEGTGGYAMSCVSCNVWGPCTLTAADARTLWNQGYRGPALYTPEEADASAAQPLEDDDDAEI